MLVKETKGALNNKFAVLFLLLVMVIGFTNPLQAGNKSIVKVGSDVRVEQDDRIDDAVAVGGDLFVDGIVDGDAVAVGGSVYLGEEAVIHGDAVTIGGSIEQAEGSIIYGTSVDVSSIILGDIFDEINFRPGFHGIPWGLRFIPAIGLIALALLLSVIMPKELNKVSTIVKNEPVIMFLYGLLGIILIIPLAVMLVISIVGIALIPIELLAVFLASLIGYVAVAILIGKKILKAMNSNEPNIIISALLGIILLWLVGLIPFFGGLVKGLACITGFGAVIIAVARRNKKDEELVIEKETKEKK
jgi:hypothetical protein